MAISGTNVATVGPVQNIATRPVDIGAVGPNGETTGNAQVVVIDGTITATIDESTLATSAKQDTGNTSLATLAAGNSFSHIATATTTTVKSGAGVLHSITINALGTVASTTTVYNNTAGSGAVIAIINTLAGQESYIYDVAFSIGLTLVTTGTVAPDITVSYR